MTVESANYVDDLVSANPAQTDDRSEGDNHLRLIKLTLKQTFPGLAGRLNRFQSKSGNYTAVLGDANSIIHFTAGATLDLTAAATLGNGWSVLVHALGGGVTVNPDGAELINGASTMSLNTGDMALVACIGTAFYGFVLQKSAVFPSGTRTTFQQTAAPTGWTKVTDAAYNDAAIRLITGTVAPTGGGDAFSSVFGTGKVTSGTAISVAQMPSHTPSGTVNIVNGGVDLIRDGGGSYFVGSGAPTVSPIAAASAFSATFTGNSIGSGQAHTHPLTTMNIKYADFILAQKD